MNHTFLSSAIDKAKCARCARSLMAHTTMATCESCSAIGTCNVVDDVLMCLSCETLHKAEGTNVNVSLPVAVPDIFPDIPGKTEITLEFAERNNIPVLIWCSSCHEMKPDTKNYSGVWLCWSCRDTQIETVITSVNEHASKTEVINQVLSDARSIDSTIRYNGDVFNARTVSNSDLKRAIWSDDTLTTDQKQHKYYATIAQRYEILAQAVFVLNNEILDRTNEMLADAQTLRDEKNELAKEYAAKMKEADSSYVPIVPKEVKPKVKPVKKDPMERVIEALAVARGISIANARLILLNGEKKS